MKKFIISLITLTLLFSGCEKKNPPTACFSTDKTSYVIGEPVSFSNCSSDADEYEWTIANISSTERELNIYFQNSGDVDVTLSAKNGDGTNTETKTITIQESVSMLFTVMDGNTNNQITDAVFYLHTSYDDWLNNTGLISPNGQTEDGEYIFYGLQENITYYLSVEQQAGSVNLCNWNNGTAQTFTTTNFDKTIIGTMTITLHTCN